MIGKILECPQSFRTARALARELDVPCSRIIERTEPKYNWLFRYGGTSHLDYYPNVIINKKWAIQGVSNKFECRQALWENDVPVPTMYYENDVKNNGDVESIFPLIARPKNHFKGRHFYIVEDERSALRYLNRGYYLQRIIDKDVEYRIFVLRDKVFEVSKKEKTPMGTIKDDLIRNFDNGWRFMFQSVVDTRRDMKDYCRKAMRIMGLDWGAIDCCIDKKGDFYIFEINSAPSLIDRKVKKLAVKIKEYLSNEIGSGDQPRMCAPRTLSNNFRVSVDDIRECIDDGEEESEDDYDDDED